MSTSRRNWNIWFLSAVGAVLVWGLVYTRGQAAQNRNEDRKPGPFADENQRVAGSSPIGEVEGSLGKQVRCDVGPPLAERFCPGVGTGKSVR